MPRSKRMLYDGAVYHIVQRGHNKDRLFRKPQDYKTFKEIIRKYKEGEELPRILQGITQSYSFYYRKANNYSGYVYQNRYKNFLIEDDSYLLECGRYIERNPLRAGLVKDLSQYHWSSYNFYAEGRFDDIITPNPLYPALGKDEKERRIAYQKYVSEPRPYERVLDKAMIG